MARCFFPFCFSGGVEPSDGSTSMAPPTAVTKISRRKKRLTSFLIDSSSGTMNIPTYRTVSRDNCPLLRLAWEQRWQQVANRCVSHPQEALCLSEHSRRTALHLALLSNSVFPVECAKALLKANRHLVLVQDKENYTPLHIACFFARRQSMASSTVEEGSTLRRRRSAPNFYSTWCRRIVGEPQDCNDMISLFCDTAIMVEQEQQQRGTIPQLTGISPLFLASKRDAPLSILQILLQTRHEPSVPSLSRFANSCNIENQTRRRAEWIAPSTGGEPYWDSTTLDEYSSPLEILLRDRGPAVFGRLLVDPMLHNDDSNIGSEGETAGESQEHIERVFQVMRNVVRARLAREYGAMNGSRPKQLHGSHHDETLGVNNVSCVLRDPLQDEDDLTQLSVEDCRAILLWEKCIELLASSNNIPCLDLPASSAAFPFGVVHAVACCKVPLPSLLQLTLSVFPEQSLLRDQAFGMIPLHHVLEAQHPYATKKLLSILLLHEPVSALTAFPPRANDGGMDVSGMCDNGRGQQMGPSPLIRAMELNMPYDFIQELLSSTAAAGNDGYISVQDSYGHKNNGQHMNPLDFPDPTSGLFPFAIAASQDYDLTVVYSLLLANPQVMLHTCRPTNNSSAESGEH